MCRYGVCRQCPVSNNGFGSVWFGMVLVGHGFINCLASESFVVSYLQETENLMEEVFGFSQTDNPRFSCIMYCYSNRQLTCKTLPSKYVNSVSYEVNIEEVPG